MTVLLVCLLLSQYRHLNLCSLGLKTQICERKTDCHGWGSFLDIQDFKTHFYKFPLHFFKGNFLISNPFYRDSRKTQSQALWNITCLTTVLGKKKFSLRDSEFRQLSKLTIRSVVLKFHVYQNPLESLLKYKLLDPTFRVFNSAYLWGPRICISSKLSGHGNVGGPFIDFEDNCIR